MFNKFLKTRFFIQVTMVSLLATLAAIGLVAAATTIGTDINTGGSLTVTGTTATSTFSTGGFTIGTSQFVVQQSSGNVGIGTTSPYKLLSVAGDMVVTGSLTAATTTTSYAKTKIVSPAGGDYTSIQSAINALDSSSCSVSAPCLVKVMPGVYNEQITMHSYIDVVGSGWDSTEITRTSPDGSSNDYLVVMADNSMIEDFHLHLNSANNDWGAPIVKIAGANDISAVIRNNKLTGQPGVTGIVTGVSIKNTGGNASVIIENNYMTNIDWGIASRGNSTTTASYNYIEANRGTNLRGIAMYGCEAPGAVLVINSSYNFIKTAATSAFLVSTANYGCGSGTINSYKDSYSDPIDLSGNANDVFNKKDYWVNPYASAKQAVLPLWSTAPTTLSANGTYLSINSAAGFTGDFINILKNNSTLFKINSSGNVGIGTTSPYSLLSISNSVNTTANTPLFTIASTTAGTATSTLLTVLANGSVLVGSTASATDFPNTKLIVSQADTGLAGSLIMGVYGEAVSDGVYQARGIMGSAKSGGAQHGIGAFGYAIPGASADTGNVVGVAAYVQGAHAGGNNIAFWVPAVSGGINNYSFYGEVGTLYNAGNVGIGTTSPYSKLSVWGSGIGATSLFELTNSASTTLMTVLNNGNVGIGTTSPSYVLDVSPLSGVTNDLLRVASSTTGLGLVVKNSGNVGIATTTPAATLDINGYMRLKKNTSQPVACSTGNDGAIALNSSYLGCVCNGTSWINIASSTQTCVW